MEIVVNGERQNVEFGTTLRTFLEGKKINPNVVACELNEKIIRRAQLAMTVLSEGDHLEVIRMIGGG